MLPPPRDIPLIDGDLEREPEDIRRDLAIQGTRDLFFMGQGILGFRDMTENCHGPLCKWHDRNTKRFKLTLMPRGHLKTHAVTIAKTVQRVVRDQESRILLANETSTNAERFLAIIKSHAESNRRFRALYSGIIPVTPKIWSQQSLLFNRLGHYAEPTIDTIGMTGAMTSRHYTHMGFDDPISAEAARSKLVMDDVITRISNLMSLMVRPNEDTVDLTGTRWAFYDVYSWFEKTFALNLGRFIRSDIEDGEPIWPERFSLDTLTQIRESLGEYLYSCQYRNMPRDSENQDFNVQDLKFFRWSADEESLIAYGHDGAIERVHELEDLDIIVTVDLRYGDKLADGDRDAIVTTGSTSGGDAFVLDTWGKRGTPLDVVEHLIHLVKRFRPRVIGIQKVGYEMSLKWHLQAALEREMLYANIVPVKPGGPGKPHIRGLQPIAATGHLYILPSQHVLRNELAEYPLGKHDDVADALALQQQLWRGLLSAERMVRYRESEKRVLRAIDSDQPDRQEALALTAGELEDRGYDAEQHRYGPISEVVIP